MKFATLRAATCGFAQRCVTSTADAVPLPLEGKASCQQNLKLQTPKETRHEPTVQKYAEQ